MLAYHRVLLADRIRTLAFRDAIRRTVKPGQVVVDLGSGSGVLAFFACEAGASRVYAIEKQHMADVISLLARQNGYDDRVVVLHEYSLEATIPERADVLVTEMLSALGFEEQILGLVLDARARYLKDGAAIIPQRVVVSIVPVELPDDFASHLAWWSEPRYDLELGSLRTFASNVIYHTHIESSAHLAKPAEIIDVDLLTVSTSDARGQAAFTVERDGALHGFSGWFTATLAPGITLSNERPHETHWFQAFLPLETAINVKRGDAVELELETSDGRKWRWRGRVAGQEFDQTTWLSAPPCTLLQGEV